MRRGVLRFLNAAIAGVVVVLASDAVVRAALPDVSPIGDAFFLSRIWELLQNAGVFGTALALWLLFNERKRNDESKRHLHARIEQLEKTRDELLREVLVTVHKMTAAVAEAGVATEATAANLVDLAKPLQEIVWRMKGGAQ